MQIIICKYDKKDGIKKRGESKTMPYKDIAIKKYFFLQNIVVAFQNSFK